MSFSTQIVVPKSHPGLPRLLEATKRLPNVEFESEGGVSVKKKQLLLPGVYEEFFDALGDVIGHQHADDILNACCETSRNRLQEAGPAALMDLAKNLQGMPLLSILKMFGG